MSDLPERYARVLAAACETDTSNIHELADLDLLETVYTPLGGSSEFESMSVEDLSLSNAVDDAAAAVAERMEKELHGAWRAGYDYLHVYREAGGLTTQELSEQVSITQYVLPSNNEHPIRPDELAYEYTYDIGCVPDHVIREMVEQGAGIGYDAEN